MSWKFQQYFAGYRLSPSGNSLQLAVTVNIHEPNVDDAVLTMRSIAAGVPEMKWTQGPVGERPSATFAFLPSAVA